MACYTVPFHRGGTFGGIVNVDLSVKYFERLGEWLRDLDFGGRSYGFVISRAGLIISHPLAEYDFAARVAAGQGPRHLTELGTADAEFQELTLRMLDEDAGAAAALDPSTGRAATWLLRRVQPAGWTFVAVVDEAAPA
jgi:hypothetical protein